MIPDAPTLLASRNSITERANSSDFQRGPRIPCSTSGCALTAPSHIRWNTLRITALRSGLARKGLAPHRATS